MRLALLSFKWLAAFLLFMLAFSVHAGQAGSIDILFEKREGQAWLKKIYTAAQKLNYSGTFVYQQGTQLRTSRITHVQHGKDGIAKLEILDGKPREYIRNNEEIIYYVSETKHILIEKRITKDVFPSILPANSADLMDYYYVKKGKVGRVAGFDCQIVILEPKDTLRYGYQLWVEKVTGLLLRAQTFNEKNEVVEQITFTHISIGNIDRSRVKSSFTNVSAWHVENAVMNHIKLHAWSVKWLPPGFKKIHEIKRLVSGVSNNNNNNTHATSANSREVSQIVFSDGLAAISVFIEPGTQSLTEGSMQQGAMSIMGKRQGDFWITIMGEVPALAVKKLADSIEYKSK